MKAVQLIYSGLNEPIGYIHEYVIETYTIGANKHYKCLKCGHEWDNSIHSSTIKTDQEIKESFSNYPPCQKNVI